MKIAFVYDRVNKIGGAERVLVALGKLFPKASLYAAVYNKKTAPWADTFQVIPSFLQKFPLARTRHEFYPWLTPLAFESFSFDKFDAVISVTSAEAKGIITKPETFHLCYCLTPTRYLWSGASDYKVPFWGRPAVSWLKSWDRMAGQRPDVYLAISENVKRRIKKYYRRDSEVVYPPVNLKKWKMDKREQRGEKYFLIVSRLVPYKKNEIAIKAFNRLSLPLKIVGTGVEEEKLKRQAGENIEFLGQLTDRKLLGYYQKAEALVFPQEEDFGLVPLEAQACGTPVIAYRGGGALETVVEGKTGEFFYPQETRALEKVVKEFRKEKYNLSDCRAQAEKFGQELFERDFKKTFEKVWKNHLKNISL